MRILDTTTKMNFLKEKAKKILKDPATNKEQVIKIYNLLEAEEEKLRIELKKENNITNGGITKVYKNKKELFRQALDLQNYILGNPNSMENVKNTLGTGMDSSGGVAVGRVLSEEIIRTLKEKANVYNFFDARIGEGDFQIIIISEETPAEWIPEGETPTGQGDIKTSKLILKQHRLYKEIELTQQLINSAPEEFIDEIKNIIADAIKDTLEKAIFTGTGVGQPTGIVNNLSNDRKIVLERLGGITLDILKKAKSKVSGRDLNNCSWFMDSTTLLVLDNLKDDTGRPLLQPNPSQPTKQIILGIEVKITESLHKIDELDSVITVLAHKNSYQTNTQKTLVLDVYNDSAYRRNGIVGFASNIYVDGICKNQNKVVAIFNPKSI